MEQRVITLFHESIEAKMQAGEHLAPLIAEASNMIVHSLLNESKILICGNGIATAHAQIFSTLLVDRFERERPGLPAIALASDFVTQSAIANDSSYNDIYSKQVRALGQPGDTLICISSSGNSSNMIQAVAAAHDRDIQVIAITGGDGGNISSLLDVNDIELRATVHSRSRIHEIHLLTIFCLCDLIDQQLFGTID